MKTPTLYIKRCLLMAALLTASALSVQAADTFKARVRTTAQQTMNISLSASDTIPLSNLGTIYALSIDAVITQPREASFVRIVLEDVEGHNYLVAESDRFRNDTTTVNLSEYCEETAQLNGITPLRLKCYLTHASLQLTGIHTSNKIPTRGVATEQELRAMKEAQVQSVVDRINEYNVRHGKLWRAGATALARKSYDEQHTYDGEDVYMANYKYYIDGFYEFGERRTQASAYNSPFVDSFDWRDRHGKNWITSVKDQGATPFCMAFAVTGMLEALTRIYFNDTTINIDLSEQSVIGYLPYSAAYDIIEELNFISVYGVLNETPSMPYTGNTGGNIAQRPEATDTVSFVSYNGFSIGNTEASADQIKGIIINNGPCVWGYNYPQDEILYNGIHYYYHIRTLVGYGTITNEDIQNHLQTTIVDSTMYTSPVTNSLLGRTYWIMKDSYGTTTDSIYHHHGYRYVVFNDYSRVRDFKYINSNIIWNQRTDDDIICEDTDSDGYFYWGLSEDVPANLPSWAERKKDGNDNKPMVGNIGYYGHPTDLTSSYSGITYIEGDKNDDDLVSIHGGRYIRGTVCVDNGSLSITHEVACHPSSHIVINNASTLRINGGKLYNPNITTNPGCHIIIENGGQIIYDKKPCDFNVPTGVILEMTEGGIVY